MIPEVDLDRNRLPFRIRGHIVDFRPHYVPDRLQVSKERNLVRHANFCGLEDVFEIHGHNREIHLTGKLLHSEVAKFESVIDNSQTAELLSAAWSGEVRTVQGEYEGPIGWDPIEREYLWSYTLDLVSTGLNEVENIRYASSGIVNTGRSTSTEQWMSWEDRQRTS